MFVCLWHPRSSEATDDGAEAPTAAVDQFLESQLRDAGVPGGAVVVVRGDRIVHARGFGRADAAGTPVTEHTPFVIGSVSKSFTALGVMQLVERGRLELDAPVQRYLPWFRVADAKASSQLTVEMLLTHTSGISTADGVNPLRGPISTLDGQVRALTTITTDPQPSRFMYSNANYQVLGSIIESVSGLPYEEYIRDNIFEPLEMRSSFTSLDAASNAGLADGHRLFFGMSRPGQPFYRSDFLPAGWLVSSAQDLGNYLIAQLNEGRFRDRQLLSAEAINQMHRGTTEVPGPGETHYGMGWFSGNRNGLDGVWHSGSNTDMQAVLILLPESDSAVGVLFNATSTLYEFFQKLDSIAWGVAAIVANQSPRGTLEMMYPAFGLAVVFVTVLQVRQIIQLIRHRPRRGLSRWLQARLSPRTRISADWAVAVLTVTSGISLLVVMPILLAAPWTILVLTDLGLWVGVAAILQLIIGALRFRDIWHFRNFPQQPAPSQPN